MKQNNDLILNAADLTKRFGDFTAVDSISFSVRKGECFGFLGPNGAGKTTIMRMITNHLPVTEGTLSVLGMNVSTNARKVKSRIGIVPQENNLDMDLTVIDNLIIYSRYHGIGKREPRLGRHSCWIFFSSLSTPRALSCVYPGV